MKLLNCKVSRRFVVAGAAASAVPARAATKAPPRAVALIGDRAHNSDYIRISLDRVFHALNIPIDYTIDIGAFSTASLRPYQLLLIFRDGDNSVNGYSGADFYAGYERNLENAGDFPDGKPLPWMSEEQGAAMIWTPHLSQVDIACSKIMGLRPGDVYYATCHESLSQSLAAQSENRALAAAYGECHQLGMVSGSADFSTCVLDKENAGEAAFTRALTVADSVNANASADKSLYEMSPTVRWNRERHACAQMSLVPGSDDFRQCIDNLDEAFLPSQN